MIESIHALLLLAGAVWFGNFLAGFLGAEALGLRLRDWLRRK